MLQVVISALLGAPAPALAGGITVDVAGSCPGSTTVSVANGTPNGRYAILTANVPGTAPYPAGPCAGMASGLGQSGLTFRLIRTLDASGADALSPTLPEAVCGQFVAVLDVSSCVSSTADRLPTPDVVHYGGPIEGVQEVPPTPSGSFGLVTGTLDGTDLDWVVSAVDFTNTLTAAHFHNAPTGTSGPAIETITGELVPTGSRIEGDGLWAMTGGEVGELDAGNIYVNLHSNVFSGGEIRGQVFPSTLLGGIIDGDQEVPPTGSTASGFVTLSLSSSDVLTWFLRVDGLTNALTAAHFHLAPAGTNGGAILTITGDLTQSGGTVAGAGTWALTPTQAADLLNGGIYVNLHTGTFPGGEVRGQVLTE